LPPPAIPPMIAPSTAPPPTFFAVRSAASCPARYSLLMRRKILPVDHQPRRLNCNSDFPENFPPSSDLPAPVNIAALFAPPDSVDI
jgi:hypothetical protein